MIIENHPKEIQAMQEFHKGNRAEGLRFRRNLPLNSARNMPKRITVPARKPAVTTETAKNASLSTVRIRSTFPTVCAR